MRKFLNRLLGIPRCRRECGGDQWAVYCCSAYGCAGQRVLAERAP